MEEMYCKRQYWTQKERWDVTGLVQVKNDKGPEPGEKEEKWMGMSCLQEAEGMGVGHVGKEGARVSEY